MTGTVAIVGAGPYGLATAAYLRRRGIDAAVFGETMGAWSRMPAGMLLRSFREATSIGDPDGRLTIEAYAADRGRPVPTPVPVTDFVDYGKWFQAQSGIEVDTRLTRRVERAGEGFRVTLDDHSELDARAVVVAAGIEPFARVPPPLAHLDPARISHSSQHRDFVAFAGRRLLVIGAGQSALEWSVLAAEAGAQVEVVARRPLRFLRGERLHDRAGALRAVLYPALGVGPPGLNWVMGHPIAFRRLPRTLAQPLAQRSIRPAGAAWLRPRLASVTVTSGAEILSVEDRGDDVALKLSDGSERRADHVMAATGYRIDIAKYSFLPDELVGLIRRVDGFPRLSGTYESSVAGLHFVGAPAAASMGPGMRFVSHSGAAAAAVARGIGRTR